MDPSRELRAHLDRSLNTFPRFPLSLLPTPCHRLNTISKRHGVAVFCKRDDLSGFAMGGNKTRKLEFLLGEALEHGCDTLVTAGGIQSNFCRVTAMAGVAAGLDVHLVLGGGRPAEPSGNLLLAELVGAQIGYVDSPRWEVWEEESRRVAESLTARGRRVFRMPIGGAVPVGAMGYVQGFLEILLDQERLGREFDVIVHASGSGGTQAGLLAAAALTRWPGKVVGVSVAKDRKELARAVAALSGQTAGLLGAAVDQGPVEVDDHHVGPGYAHRTREGDRAVAHFAAREGVVLDHVYTGKAAGALLNWLEQGRFAGRTVLFLHTGGQPEIFARS